MIFDPLDAHSWLIGPLPILVSFAGLYQYGLAFTGTRDLNNDRMMSIWGLSAGITVCVAWLMGYRTATELQVETVAFFCAVMAILMIVLGFLITRKSDFARAHFRKLSMLPRSTLIARLFKSLFMFGGFLIVVWLFEYFVEIRGPCTRLNCRMGELLFGSRDSFLSLLWIYIMIGGLVLSAVSYMLYLSVTAKNSST